MSALLSCIRCEQEWPEADYPRGCPACHSAGFPANMRVIGQPAWHALRLGEGSTPLTPLPLDYPGRFWLKQEWQNPTGSHKDRFSAYALGRALASGCERVAAASSGNAGVSLAAYAAHAGLKAEIAVTAAISKSVRDALERLNGYSSLKRL